MLFMIVLVVTTATAWLVGRRRASWRSHVRRGMGVAMIVAGASHLLRPDPFLQHLPESMPLRDAAVAVSGVVEIVLGGLVLWNARFRREIGLALAVYLVGVFPANVYVAVEGIDVDGQPGGPYPWVRLPLQALFVFIAWWSTRDTGPEEGSSVDSRLDQASAARSATALSR